MKILTKKVNWKAAKVVINIVNTIEIRTKVTLGYPIEYPNVKI